MRSVDTLIAVGGSGRTAQELALAIEHDIQVMPMPTFGGAARDVWNSYRSEIVQALRIDEHRAKRWEQPTPTTSDLLHMLAMDMVDALIASLPKRCFVIMPFKTDFDKLFDEVILPAITRAGDRACRRRHQRTLRNASVSVNQQLRSACLKDRYCTNTTSKVHRMA